VSRNRPRKPQPSHARGRTRPTSDRPLRPRWPGSRVTASTSKPPLIRAPARPPRRGLESTRSVGESPGSRSLHSGQWTLHCGRCTGRGPGPARVAMGGCASGLRGHLRPRHGGPRRITVPSNSWPAAAVYQWQGRRRCRRTIVSAPTERPTRMGEVSGPHVRSKIAAGSGSALVYGS
jgi:hypothetical protein